MIDKHLLNTKEFWGEWVIPSIERGRSRIQGSELLARTHPFWGPDLNYLVYLGLQNYDNSAVRRDFAQKSYDLFCEGMD